MTLTLYTALYGQKEPPNPDVFGGFSNVRRLVFTDRADLDPAVFGAGVERILDPLDGLDPARASRRAKLMPHRYLGTGWSLWIDNKSRLKRDPVEVLAAARAQSDAGFFAFPHFARDDVYAELQTCWENGLDDYAILKERERTYRAEGMPARTGLIEGHLILRRHGDPDLMRFGEEWFEQVRRYSRRDQISFPYLAWKLALRYETFATLDWRETVQHDRIDRANRKPDFPRKRRAYQAARALYHRLRRTLGR